MADTKISLQLECENLIDGIDKFAAKIESFSKRAKQSIDLVDKKTEKMGEIQKRAYDVVKKSYDKHQEALNEISKRYEELRKKQETNIDFPRSERAELQSLLGQYEQHLGAIIS